MTVFGYGRVSKDESTSLNQQMDIEKALGVKVDHWFEDHAVSGSTKTNSRQGFSKIMSMIKSGDMLVISRVDRIGRRASDVLNTVEGLLEQGIDVYILQIGKESLRSPMGKFALGIFSIFAENERLSCIERTNSGLSRAKAQGKILGSRFKLPPESLQQAHKWMAEKVKHEDIAHRLNIGVATLYNLKREFMGSGEKMQEYKKRYDAQQLQIKSNNA